MKNAETTGDPHTVRRFIAVALVFPVVLTLVAIIVQLMLLPHVPDVIASHWDASGTADGFAPAWLNPLMTAVLGLGIPALFALMTLPGLRRGDRGVSYRFMGATSAATSMLIASLLTWTLAIQIGVSDPATVELPFWPAIVVVFGLALLTGVAAWLAQPHDYPEGTTALVPAEPIPLAAGERAVWMRHASIGRGGIIAILTAVIVLTALALAMWLLGAEIAVAWLLTVLALTMLVIAATTVTFYVRVDETGLHVDSALGLPRFRVPLDDVATASVVDVVPMGEFGGWGIRLAPGRRFGVVLRAGSAIEVTRRDGRRFVVTVDDAATGAALLEALAERERS